MDIRLASFACAATLIVGGAGAAAALGAKYTAPDAADDPLVQTFDDVARNTAWTKTGTLNLTFDTFHPQAMEVVGDRIFLSSVEIIERPVKYTDGLHDGYDRTPGKGVGHLFVLDRQGNLLKDITLGEGDMYHPGGLDYDGTNIYLPVAEYRPNSSAIIYRVDPATYQVEKLFTVRDHVGGVVHDLETDHLIGQSWGSRRFYDWTMTGKQKQFSLNDSHFVDYQDCEYVATGRMLCSGIAGLPAPPGAATGYELGGLAMIDISSQRILHEVPVQLWSTAGHVVTRNPVDVDGQGNHLTLYAAPDDFGEGQNTQILTYEADVTPLS